jgi:DNA repair protein RadC
MPRPTPYPVEPERIYLGGFEAVRRRRKKVCTSRRYKYAWMRIEPCVEMPESDEEVPSILSSKDANDFIHEAVPFAGRPGEHFMVVCMDNRNVPFAVAVPFIGGRNSAVVDKSIVFQAVLLAGSVAFLVAHNHPSNEVTPSPEDVSLSRSLKRGSELLGLNFLDSLVVTDDPEKYASLADMGLLSGD